MKPAVVKLGLFAIAAAGAACRERDHEGTRYSEGLTTLTASSWYPTESAVDRIVTARCEHLFACNEIGPDAHYQTTDACVLDHRRAVRSAMSTSECPDGVDGRALDACVGAIRQDPCGLPPAATIHAPACQARELCLRH
jgi:hypothetical protein